METTLKQTTIETVPPAKKEKKYLKPAYIIAGVVVIFLFSIILNTVVAGSSDPILKGLLDNRSVAIAEANAANTFAKSAIADAAKKNEAACLADKAAKAYKQAQRLPVDASSDACALSTSF